ncbi:unnamed protein product [Notodromas monacha]|uniref:ABTB2/3 histone-like domain-containing protein n=1 Tax=Notodromas monacha TaxID=399045 RepID=A0A7R9BK71_9CRUS|nr:unnamed protein product [Notodromas monacha]CAG0917017.1 unnamed protein product [Notodromas monacha]
MSVKGSTRQGQYRGDLLAGAIARMPSWHSDRRRRGPFSTRTHASKSPQCYVAKGAMNGQLPQTPPGGWCRMRPVASNGYSPHSPPTPTQMHYQQSGPSPGGANREPFPQTIQQHRQQVCVVPGPSPRRADVNYDDELPPQIHHRRYLSVPESNKAAYMQDGVGFRARVNGVDSTDSNDVVSIHSEDRFDAEPPPQVHHRRYLSVPESNVVYGHQQDSTSMMSTSTTTPASVPMSGASSVTVVKAKGRQSAIDPRFNTDVSDSTLKDRCASDSGLDRITASERVNGRSKSFYPGRDDYDEASTPSELYGSSSDENRSSSGHASMSEGHATTRSSSPPPGETLGRRTAADVGVGADVPADVVVNGTPLSSGPPGGVTGGVGVGVVRSAASRLGLALADGAVVKTSRHSSRQQKMMLAGAGMKDDMHQVLPVEGAAGIEEIRAALHQLTCNGGGPASTSSSCSSSNYSTSSSSHSSRKSGKMTLGGGGGGVGGLGGGGSGAGIDSATSLLSSSSSSRAAREVSSRSNSSTCPAAGPLARHSSLETVNTNVTAADEFVWVDSHNSRQLASFEATPGSEFCRGLLMMGQEPEKPGLSVHRPYGLSDSRTSPEEVVYAKRFYPLVELQQLPWTVHDVLRVVRRHQSQSHGSGGTLDGGRHSSPSLAASSTASVSTATASEGRVLTEVVPRLCYLLQRVLVRVGREAQRLAKPLGMCSKQEIAAALRVVLSSSLADSCVKACLRAAAMYAVSGDQLKQSKSSRAGLQLSVGRFHRWMADVRLGRFIHE